jgi:hypothetical protein
MIKQISIIALLSLTISGMAQVWCYPGSEWYYDRNSITGNGYARLTYIGDTMFHSKNCNHILYYSQEYVYMSQNIQVMTLYNYYYTYTENNIVYMFYSFLGQFDTIANFNATPGDKWFLPHDNDCGTIECDVIDTGHIVIQAKNLKWLKVEYNGVPDYIYERIGNLRFYPPDMVKGCISDNPLGGPLRCYSDNEISNFKQFQPQNNCNYINAPAGIFETVYSNNNVKVYPNPTDNKLIVAFCGQRQSISLTNPIGQILLKKEEPKTEEELDLSQIPKGIYFLNVWIDGTKKTYKVIKE